MFTSENSSFEDASPNAIALAVYEFRLSPIFLSQNLIERLVVIKLLGNGDYIISNNLWLLEYFQTGMILLGVEDAIPFLKTDIDRCIEIFSNAMELFEENY